MTRFNPSPAEIDRIGLQQQDRAGRLAARIIAARHALMRGEKAAYVLSLLDADRDVVTESEQRRADRLLDVISGVERAVDAHAFDDEDGVGWVPLDRITEALWPEKAPG